MSSRFMSSLSRLPGPSNCLTSRWRTTSLFAIAFVLSSQAIGNTAAAQDASIATATTTSSQYIPDDALAVAMGTPQELFSNPAFEMFPLEVLRAQSLDKSGIDPMDVSSIKVIVGVPGPAGPPFGMVAEFRQDVATTKLSELLDAEPRPMPVGDYSAYALRGTPGMVLYQKDARTLFIATPNYLGPIVTSNQGTGPLPTIVAKMPKQSGLTIVAVLEPVRPMVSGLAMQQSQSLPQPLQPLGRIPGFVDALLIHASLNASASTIKLSLLCMDEGGATQVESILNDSMQFGREMGIAEMQKGMATSNESEAVKQATFQYANRMADMVTKTLTPTRTGRRVDISLESEAGIATTGVLVGLLLPAIQASREAARRMNASNNIKQIMLAMHNYHSAYNHLPPAAITDADGKPLLSWRVAILPFIEQQALYQQFHLDEPWDSPHNLPLSKILPSVYVDPSAPLQPGFTILHAVVGDDTGLKTSAKIRFRDFTDGLSNSLLIVEARRDAAVPWSKPEDVSIDLNNPLANMGNTHPGGFHVGMADGSVRFIASSIDPQVFRAMLTRANGEAVGF